MIRLLQATSIILLLTFTASDSMAGVRAMLNYAVFNSPEEGPYIETYLSIQATSENYKKLNDGMFQCAVEVTMVFRTEEDIIDFDKYELKSPKIADTTDILVNMLDQQRYFLPEGEYEFQILLVDINNSDSEPTKTIQPLLIDFDDEEICFSGIELVDSISIAKSQSILTKSGYDIIPMVYNLFPGGIDRLTFYTEIYNTDKLFGNGEKFLLKYYLKSFESGLILDNYVFTKRADAASVYPLLSEYDISSLPSGGYMLNVEIRDKNNDLVKNNMLFFQRENPDLRFDISHLTSINLNETFASRITNEDTLTDYIHSLHPRATSMEQFFINKTIKTADLQTKQKFFYNFWLVRNRQNPEEAWLAYNELVRVVNDRYSTQIARGYDTDRGRVYLKYGPPNIITESYNEPSSYPYEIWQFYRLGESQSNKRFVFYTHDIITNNFELLHSDAIGEIANYRWQVVLNKRWYDPDNLDIDQVPNLYGGHVDDYYRNPR